MKLKPWHVFAAALALRLAFVLAVPQRPVYADAVDYDTIGWNLASGGGFSMVPGVPSVKRPPLYPAALAAVYKAAGHSYPAARAVQALMGAFTCLFLFLAARELFGRRAALAAAVICAVHPVMIAYSGLLLNEEMFTCLMACSMWLFLLWRRRRGTGLLAVFALAAAAATLTKPTLVLMPVLLFAAEAWYSRDLRGTLKAAALAAAVFCAALVPWSVRNYRAFGKVIPFAGQHGPVFFLTMAKGGPSEANTAYIEKLTAGLDETAADAALQRELEAELARPLACAVNVIKSARFLPRFWITSHSSVFGVDRPNAEYRAAGEWGKLAFKGLLLALQLALLAACACGIWRVRSVPGALFFVVPLFYFSLHFNGVPRYHVPVMPYMFAFAALCLTGLEAEKEA